MEQNRRIGPKSTKDILPDILLRLNKGEIESVNLTEWLVVDHSTLVASVLKGIYRDTCLSEIKKAKSKSAMQMIKLVGYTLCKLSSEDGNNSLYDELKNHTSDSVRCWAAYMLGTRDDLSLKEKLNEIKYFAQDTHFGVREISWMAVREDLENNLDEALIILEGWTKDKDVNIRRFATESIRPKGVWCKQINRLKENPELAFPILNNLKSDASKYVQDSVANWLNDASKSRPDFVKNLCLEWMQISPCAETKYIVKRALRTIEK